MVFKLFWECEFYESTWQVVDRRLAVAFFISRRRRMFVRDYGISWELYTRVVRDRIKKNKLCVYSFCFY